MSDLLRAIATLRQVSGPVPVRVLPAGVSDGVRLTHTGALPVVEVAALHDGSDRGRHQAEAYARMLSGAPAMLDLLATVLVRWSRAVERDQEINGGDAVDWLAEFATEVKDALQGIVGPPTTWRFGAAVFNGWVRLGVVMVGKPRSCRPMPNRLWFRTGCRSATPGWCRPWPPRTPDPGDPASVRRRRTRAEAATRKRHDGRRQEHNKKPNKDDGGDKAASIGRGSSMRWHWACCRCAQRCSGRQPPGASRPATRLRLRAVCSADPGHPCPGALRSQNEPRRRQ